MKYSPQFNGRRRLRLAVQLAFLALFLFLLAIGRVQLWMPIFLFGVVTSLIFSRFYCGYLCQMGTLFRSVNWLKTRLHLPQFEPPAFLQQRWLRFAMIFVTLGSMIVLQQLDVGIEVLGLVTVASVLVTLFFHESFWHNQLCPYGAILSLTTRSAPFRIRIDEEHCIACGVCKKVCPSQTITTLDSKKCRVGAIDCLVCDGCRAVCPPDVIRYGR